MTRVLVALFTVCWLGLAVQPCVAMDHSGDRAHSGHQLPSDEAIQPCPHCPPPTHGNDDCGQVVAPACDGASASVLPSKDLKIAQPDLVLLSGFVAFQYPSIGATATRVLQADAGRWPPPTASLQQRFCTFLK